MLPTKTLTVVKGQLVESVVVNGNNEASVKVIVAPWAKPKSLVAYALLITVAQSTAASI